MSENPKKEEEKLTISNVVECIFLILFATFMLFVICAFFSGSSIASYGFGILLGVELFITLIGALVIGFRISKN